MDTNILLDMIVDRRNNVSVGLMEAFIKLLEYDEIKLIIPAIVVHETNKHIEEQLNLVGNKIFNAKKSLKAMCGINGYKTEGFDIETEKKELLLKINELYEKYNLNKEVYLTNIRVTIEKIFNHDNCVIVQDTEQLRNLCLQRRIYKRAPFHYEKKESFADGLITEILIHYWEDEEVSLDENDDIIFVTGNTKDFSKCDENSILHDDIREDLEKVGLLEKVTYINSFSELIGKELRQEIDNANLEEEFEKELQEQEELDEEQLYADVLDMDREAVGLSSLSCYEDKFIDDFYESEFKEKLYITFFLSFHILSNVRKALFYRLYGHLYFLFTFAYRGISSYVFPLKRGKFRGKYFYAIRRFISVLALSIEECAYQSIVILILE